MKNSIALVSAVMTAVAARASGALEFKASITVDASTRYQTMIGGGCSGAFGAACSTATLSAADQEAVAATLFGENAGGLSVLRNLIGSSAGATILPSCPATPAGPFDYVASLAALGNGNNDTCQLTLARAALRHSPDLFLYADAWSAPGCFKSNGQEAGGGYLCGVRRTNCTHDWRGAYADYLIEYVRLYQQEGIKTSLLGAYNEPDYNPVTYSAMLSDGYQAYDFLSVLYPRVKAAFPDLKVACCDSTGARQQRTLLYELGRLDGGLGLFDVNTYHNYQSDVKRPFDDLLSVLPGGQQQKPTLETEWSDGGAAWTPTWDVSGQNFEGLQWAVYMHNAFRHNVAGWSHWWCAYYAGGDAALVRVAGSSYQVAARLWAFAGYFRFARPGAVRLAADVLVASTSSGNSSDSGGDDDDVVEDLYVTAWENANGTVAVPVINLAHYTYTLDIAVPGTSANHAVAYLVDNEHNVTADGEFNFTGGRFTAQIEPRAMKTFFLDQK
ncbi:glycoside hydrolase family 30 protein [Xylariaceae sp. FL0804]|nr:glycoside hydrolase family 30 protein [Xylariaceae sp. FL0804]